MSGDPSVVIARLGAIEEADATTLTFATGERYVRAALASRAGAVLVDAALAPAESPKPLIVVPSARAALAHLLDAFAPPRPRGPSRHPTAAIDPTATIADGVVIGPHVSVGARARIGADTVLLAGVVVGDDAVVGARCLFQPRAMLLDRCEAGDRVILQAGAVVGSDGFGNVFIDGAFRTIPQVGNVVLGDDVEVGANTCIDRAQTGTTSIGTGTKIDNLVQIGHNCKIGNHNVIAGMVGFAGSTTMGDYCRIGGQSAFRGHITVGSRVTVAGNTMVWGDLPDDAFVSGQPAQPHRAEVRQQVYLRKLPKLFARVDALEGKTERPAGA